MHFSTFNIVQNALVPQHINIIYIYLKVDAFGRVLTNYVNFVPVNMSKWLNGPCYIEIEIRSGILEVKIYKKSYYS